VTLGAFVSSLEAPAPPRGLPAALRGLWHALRGEWDRAHDEVQPDSRECAWVHAALHRDEGDDDNAGYWYERAGRRPATGPMRDEYLAIAASLLGDSA
jgi:hypothetical protein